MKKGIGYSIAALCGAIVGGVTVHFYERKRCDIKIKEAEDRATQFYMNKLQDICYDELPVVEEINDTENVRLETPPIVKRAYAEMVKTSGYEPVETEDDPAIQGIYEMDDRDEFGEDGRETMMFSYYIDGVFVDEDFNELTKNDIYKYFGDFPVVKTLLDDDHDGLLYLTNEKITDTGMNFEITECPMTWADAKRNLPYDD